MDTREWLTAVLRPAGALDPAAVRRLGAALDGLSAASDMVIVDLGAADVRDPRALATALRGPALAFEDGGRCLLVVGASDALTAEFDRAGVPIVSLAGEGLDPAPGRGLAAALPKASWGLADA